MSNLRIDNIAPSAGGTYRNAPRGIAAAWVNFQGTGTVAIRDSENVSSLTDDTTGEGRINYTNAMSNANYSVSSDCMNEWFGNGGGSGRPINSMAYTSSQHAFSVCEVTSGAPSYYTRRDILYVYAQAHGDLA